MKITDNFSDKTAISLSLLCAIHCLFFPLLLVLSPTLASLQLDNEAFHVWMVAAVLPISIYALTMGCKKHKRVQLLVSGLVGLSLLVTAVALGEDKIGEFGEKGLTLLASIIIAYGHYQNYRACQDYDKCGCQEQQAEQYQQ